MSILDQFSLDGKRALVTGASRGIGRAIALGLAEAGADVALVARSRDALEDAARQVEALGRTAFVRPADLADVDVCPAVVEQARDALGTLDVLCHAAGITERAPAEDVTMEEVQRVFDVNTRSGLVLAQAVARGLLAEGKPGSLLFICSLMSQGARPTTVPYGISKTALRGLIQGLATEWGARGIRANGIAPGYVRTDLTKPLYTDPEFSEWVISRTPLARWSEPDDLVPLAVFLASDASAFLTGQIIFCDGGWTAAL
jgi:gluconate 5-dehydrogenase